MHEIGCRATLTGAFQLWEMVQLLLAHHAVARVGLKEATCINFHFGF